MQRLQTIAANVINKLKQQSPPVLRRQVRCNFIVAKAASKVNAETSINLPSLKKIDREKASNSQGIINDMFLFVQKLSFENNLSKKNTNICLT